MSMMKTRLLAMLQAADRPVAVALLESMRPDGSYPGVIVGQVHHCGGVLIAREDPDGISFSWGQHESGSFLCQGYHRSLARALIDLGGVLQFAASRGTVSVEDLEGVF